MRPSASATSAPAASSAQLARRCQRNHAAGAHRATKAHRTRRSRHIRLPGSHTALSRPLPAPAARARTLAAATHARRERRIPGAQDSSTDDAPAAANGCGIERSCSPAPWAASLRGRPRVRTPPACGTRLESPAPPSAQCRKHRGDDEPLHRFPVGVESWVAT